MLLNKLRIIRKEISAISFNKIEKSNCYFLISVCVIAFIPFLYSLFHQESRTKETLLPKVIKAIRVLDPMKDLKESDTPNDYVDK